MSVRPVETGDIERLLWIESVAWRNGVQLDARRLESQIQIFPGGQLCFEDGNGELWGFVNLMRFRFDPRMPLARSWSEITADGTIASHDPAGNWLYGVNLSVHPHGFFVGAVESLIGAAARMCAFMHLRGIVLGARMPGYARWLRDQASKGKVLDGADPGLAAAYVAMRRADGRRLDPELDLYESFGLRVIGPVPGFIRDEKSLDFGVAVAWRNFLYYPFYLCPSRRVWRTIVNGPAGLLIERLYLQMLRRGRRAGGKDRGL